MNVLYILMEIQSKTLWSHQKLVLFSSRFMLLIMLYTVINPSLFEVDILEFFQFLLIHFRIPFFQKYVAQYDSIESLR